MIATKHLAIGTAVLAAALAASIVTNLRQWSDARVAERVHAEALEAAIAEGERRALVAGIEASRRILEQAEQDRITLAAEREAHLAAMQRRERAYLARMADITLTCGPGSAFVDAFNGVAGAQP